MFKREFQKIISRDISKCSLRVLRDLWLVLIEPKYFFILAIRLYTRGYKNDPFLLGWLWIFITLPVLVRGYTSRAKTIKCKLSYHNNKDISKVTLLSEWACNTQVFRYPWQWYFIWNEWKPRAFSQQNAD